MSRKLVPVGSKEEYAKLLARSLEENLHIECSDCGCSFDDEDNKAYTNEVGACPQCKRDIIGVIVSEKAGAITEFRGEFAFLSNFYLHPIEYEGRTFGSVEAAFQSAKCLDEEEKAMFTSLAPYEAKYVGRRVKLRPDWNEVKDEVMFNLVMSKFNKNPDLKKKLLETGDAELIEGNYWHDNYWGACSCRKCANKTKRNQLGKTLSGVRTWLGFQF